MGLVGVAIAAGGSLPTTGRASAPGWARTDLRPVTQPASEAGALVLYATVKGQLRVVALDAATGKTRWSRIATPSGVTPGEVPALLVLDGRAVFMTPVA